MRGGGECGCPRAAVGLRHARLIRPPLGQPAAHPRAQGRRRCSRLQATAQPVPRARFRSQQVFTLQVVFSHRPPQSSIRGFLEALRPVLRLHRLFRAFHGGGGGGGPGGADQTAPYHLIAPQTCPFPLSQVVSHMTAVSFHASAATVAAPAATPAATTATAAVTAAATATAGAPVPVTAAGREQKHRFRGMVCFSAAHYVAFFHRRAARGGGGVALRGGVKNRSVLTPPEENPVYVPGPVMKTHNV